jgi:hypothetical protein
MLIFGAIRAGPLAYMARLLAEYVTCMVLSRVFSCILDMIFQGSGWGSCDLRKMSKMSKNGYHDTLTV